MIREATADEALKLLGEAPQGWDRWMAVADEDGEIRGHICVSLVFGQVFGHDTKYEGTDPYAALQLWRAARKQARKWGAKEVLVHVEREDDPMREFWVRRGFTRACEIYRGEI